MYQSFSVSRYRKNETQEELSFQIFHNSPCPPLSTPASALGHWTELVNVTYYNITYDFVAL